MNIRKMTQTDHDEVLAMMRVFYDSPAVLHTSSDDVLERDFAACVGNTPFLDGYIFEYSGQIAGYAMVSKSFTTEYGGLCGWIEDLYVKEPFRNQHIASRFFEALPGLYPEIVRFKLEVEPENESAIHTYYKCGYDLLPYSIMEQVMIED